MVGHQDVDAALHRDRDLGVARRPAVDRDDDRAAGRAGGLDRLEGQAVAFVLAARDVRLRAQPGPPDGQGHRREATQPVGVEVPEHEDPLARDSGAPYPGEETVRVGQQGRVMKARLGRGEERLDAAIVEEAAPDEHLEHPYRQAPPRSVIAHERRDDDRLREGPAAQGRKHRPHRRIRRSTCGCGPLGRLGNDGPATGGLVQWRLRVRGRSPVRRPCDASPGRTLAPCAYRPGRASSRGSGWR